MLAPARPLWLLTSAAAEYTGMLRTALTALGVLTASHSPSLARMMRTASFDVSSTWRRGVYAQVKEEARGVDRKAGRRQAESRRGSRAGGESSPARTARRSRPPSADAAERVALPPSHTCLH